jgi:hypothetical protein
MAGRMAENPAGRDVRSHRPTRAPAACDVIGPTQLLGDRIKGKAVTRATLGPLPSGARISRSS